MSEHCTCKVYVCSLLTSQLALDINQHHSLVSQPVYTQFHVHFKLLYQQMALIYLKPRSSYSAIKVTSKFLTPSMPGKINTGQSVTSTQCYNESVTCLAVILGCLPTSSLKFLGAHSVKTLSQMLVSLQEKIHPDCERT